MTTMPDTTASTASIAGAAVAGVGATALSALGLEPAALFWALVGASLGMSFAAATTRQRAVIVFCAVVLVCSLFGAFLAQQYFKADSLARNVIACALAIGFHPLLNAAITRLPAALDGLMRKLGIGSQQ
jgi:pimeloyl-ACP methyl ester carboxylesterase